LCYARVVGLDITGSFSFLAPGASGSDAFAAAGAATAAAAAERRAASI